MRSTTFLALVAATVLTATAAVPAHAIPTVYTITGSGSGSFGGAAFGNRAFTITLRADPDTDIGSFGIAPSFAGIDIMGIGPLTFSNQTYFGQTNGFYLTARNTLPFVQDFFDFDLPDTADIYAPFDTVTGTDVRALDQFVNVPTSGGPLTLNMSSDVQFTGRDATQVPEPATWALMLTGLGLVVAFIRRSGAGAAA